MKGDRRHLLQFRLRTFLVSVLALGFCLGMVGKTVLRQRAALANLKGAWEGTLYMGDNDKSYPMTVAIDGREIRTMIGGVPQTRCVFQIDASKSPMWIDFPMPDGSTQQGICQVTPERLMICHSQSGEARPASFEIGPADENTLLIVERSKSQAN